MKVITCVSIVLTIFGIGVYFYMSPHTSLLFDSSAKQIDLTRQIEVPMEKAPSPWADFVFEGSSEESPEGIETIVLTGKWIRPIQANSQGYVLAYKAEVALKMHDKEKFHREGNSAWAVQNYSMDFNFFLLDEDDFCLKEIITTDDNHQTFPSFGGTFIEPGKGVDVQHTILLDAIPDYLVSRIKKIVYLPRFKTCVLKFSEYPSNKPKAQLIAEEKDRLLELWKTHIDELPPKSEWNIIHQYIFEIYGGEKSPEEMNAKAAEIAKENIEIENWKIDESFPPDNPPFRKS